MPIQWTAQADQQLLAAIIKVYDVKVTGPKLSEVADIMGSGCTPKALTHRLAKIRNLAKAEHTDVAAPEAKTTSTIKQSSKVKARGGETKKTAGGRKKTACMPPDDEDDAELIHGGAAPTPPPSDRPKRRVSKRDYAQLADEDEDEDDDENGDATNQLTKKVKIEVGEDIGEGLRQTNEEGLEN